MSKTKKHFIIVPTNADCKQENVPEHLQTGPLIKYRQKEGERTCLVYSFASALHHVGTKQVASEIYQAAKKIIEKHNTLAKFADVVLSKNVHLHFVVLIANQFNILANKENDLVIASLKGDDGKEDHCVTVFGKWVFDSNFEKALPLTQESLDYCCSSDESPCKFVGVVEARFFPYWSKLLIPVEGKKKSKKNKKKK